MTPVVLAALSPLVGSFLACAALRLSEGRTLSGRSSCLACGRTLGPSELVPLLSWLLLRGRCRGCGAGVSWFYPVVELAAVAVAVAAVLLFDGWRVWAGCLLGWTLLLAALVDLRRQILPDVVTLPLLTAGLLVALSFAPDDLPGRILAAASGWLAFALLSATYRRLRGYEGLGGGDARLLGAAGAWIGPAGLPWVVLLAAAGGLLLVALAAARSGWEPGRRLPFGPFLAAATLIVWSWSQLSV